MDFPSSSNDFNPSTPFHRLFEAQSPALRRPLVAYDLQTAHCSELNGLEDADLDVLLPWRNRKPTQLFHLWERLRPFAFT